MPFTNLPNLRSPFLNFAHERNKNLNAPKEGHVAGLRECTFATLALRLSPAAHVRARGGAVVLSMDEIQVRFQSTIEGVRREVLPFAFKVHIAQERRALITGTAEQTVRLCCRPQRGIPDFPDFLSSTKYGLKDEAIRQRRNTTQSEAGF